ncbi:putative ubiquitin conjugating enzyme (UbcF) [Aspergillus nomiae NRRL 13137]|uniref:Putative ubiquitin conjugating enzyme (UbcF) n=1 Tax=Aspergillus nomiae NRRL (strain ATCC 15546 / NRRL 13137 / CBS 260.88 / M93) TaxID=1509407 RepID=A0A0L1J1L8_ASPN3|nr:putative ubiquitin conjugating enzyme (UbcF) [Aspergillus nomiae NRRL 13137]KNG85649.1 putative ubiquitin conjugating enzyme (UbcF) [Aspergillus nomiae NRRL 13137]
MSPSLRRLMKEAAELSASPSPHFHAQPVSDSNLYDWHFTIAGPPAPSPYASGIYHGRIVLPPTYPLRPPSFRFLTPTGRFEVNREICLSISGHHEETWQPAWGIRTALLAIRSFMDGDAKGQVGGLDVSEEVRRDYARRSGDWCCEVCGKSNEAILGEWRDYCKENGVEVGNMGDERVVSPVAKEEGEKGDADAPQQEEQSEKIAQDEPVAVSQQPVQQPSAPEGGVQAVFTPPRPSTSVSTSAPAPGPDAQTHLAAAAPRQPVAPYPAQAVASQQSEDPWLDRAIIGVLVALVFMILRRMAYSEE